MKKYYGIKREEYEYFQNISTFPMEWYTQTDLSHFKKNATLFETNQKEVHDLS